MLRCFLLWGLLLSSLPHSLAQSAANFHTFAQADGLSQSFITALSRSSDGFVWVGTQVGLDRFDGQEIRHFRAKRGDASSLVGGYIWAIEEDSLGYLWIGTDRGLCRYSPSTERFRRIQLTGDDEQDALRTEVVHAISWDASGQMWVGTAKGFWRFDPEQFDFIASPVLTQQQDTAGIDLVEVIHPLDDGRLLIGSAAGPFLYAPEQKQLTDLGYKENLSKRWSSILHLSDGAFLAGTHKGILRFQLEADSLHQVSRFFLAEVDNGPGNFAAALIPDGDGGFFAGTQAGLVRFSYQSAGFQISNQYKHDPNRESSLASDRVHCMYQMDENWLWIGTRQGISRRYVGSSVISKFSLGQLCDAFCSDDLKGMTLSPSGRYLVVGSNLGCSILDRQTGDVRCLDQANFPSLRNNYLINVEPGPDPDSYWLCFRRGGADLLRGVESGELRIDPIIYPGNGTSGTGVYQIALGPDGRHWMATGKGLYAYDPVSDKRKLIRPDDDRDDGLPHEYLFSLTFDHQGQLWTGSARAGLSRLITLEEERFTTWRHDPNDPNSIADDMILHLFADAKDRIWMSTPSGISVLLRDGTIRSFSSEDGILSDLVFGILEDDQQQLWINTTGGIVKARLSADEESLEILDTYTSEDGLTGGRAQYGWMLLPDGQFVLAGGGLDIYHPDSLYHRGQSVPIVFTGLQLFNKPVEIADDNSLPTALPFLSELRLAPNQDFPGFNFAALDLRPKPAEVFSYRLLGMHDEWISTQGRRWVGFPQLKPGHYQLEVRSGGVDGVTPGPASSLAIYLKAPWYQRWWAWLIYASLAASLWWAWQRQRRQNLIRIEAARLAEREAFRRRSARDFHDESGNYLTRLSLLTEVVRRQINGDRQLNGLLNQLDHNVQDLREGMRDFIWALDPGNDQVYELALRLKRFGQELFTHHPARFVMTGLNPRLEHFKLRTDQRRHLLLLLKEAMHNSLKHAANATLVELTIKVDDGFLKISWSDDGPGFSSLHQEATGNGLKNMLTRAEKISAQLELIPQKNGTCLQLQLALEKVASLN